MGLSLAAAYEKLENYDLPCTKEFSELLFVILISACLFLVAKFGLDLDIEINFDYLLCILGD